MVVRAVRGATTVAINQKEEILSVTKELLSEIIKRNNINQDDMIDIMFTVTPDLTKAFPALAAREMGITNVSLIDMAAPGIEGALEKCIRVMMHFNTDKKNDDIHSVYLRGAEILRPDIVKKEKNLTKNK